MSRRFQAVLVSFAILLTLTGLTLRAQQAAPESNDPNATQLEEVRLRVDGDRAKGYAVWLARDELYGRKSLTEGYRTAARWAADSFQEWGLKPAGQDGTYFQDVPVNRPFTHQTGQPELWIGTQEFLMEDRDFTLEEGSTPATLVESEVVFVGYGIAAPA